MIRVICRDNKIMYSAFHLVKAFFEEEQVSSQADPENGSRITVFFSETDAVFADEDRELYRILVARTKRTLPWGLLTGVRPVKLATKWLLENRGKIPEEKQEEAFSAWFYEDAFVSGEKAHIALRTAKNELKILEGVPSSFSLYIGIPFCPSVCSYCSFSSGDIGTYRDKVDPYLDALIKEMQGRAKELRGSFAGPFPYTVYIGGGTPTSLSPAQTEKLLSAAERCFHITEGISLGKVREYTVEAGRPDSITGEKLSLLKKYGVTRISVNPQTMQQKTLDLIGRKHTAKQTEEAFSLARQMGFDNINMDLIMGLPGESLEDVKDTLEKISALGPDSLTVHSLAVKRASAIGIARKTGKGPAGEQSAGRGEDIREMIQAAYDAAREMGMEPYYLYRQKSIAGNFENIGYSRPGKEGIYNILIMEEVQSIIACGAGATTKIVLKEPVPSGKDNGKLTKLVRSVNVKNIEEYIRQKG